MEEAVAVGHELNEGAEVEDRAHLAGVGLALFGELHDGVDEAEGAVDGVLVGRGHLDVAVVVDLVDRHGGARSLLDTLDHLSARADHSADQLLGDGHGDDAGHIGLVVLAGGGDGLLDDVEDMEAAVACLVEGALKHFIRQSVDLDVHLGGGDTVAGAGHLEVHVAEVILVAEDIGEHCIFGVGAGVGDKTHGDTCHRLLHLHAGVEERQGACTHGGHRRGAVRLKDVRHDAAHIGEIVGEHALQGAVGQIAVAYLAAAYAAGGACLAGREGGEVVVEQEALAALVDHVVDNLLVELGAEGHGGEGLGLAAGKHCRSVRAGDIVHLSPDGAYLVGLAAVETHTLVEHAAAHGFFLHVVVVALHQRGFLVALLFGERCDIVFADGVKRLCAPVLVGRAGLGNGICAVVALLAHVGAEGFVVDFVAVLALHGRAYLFGELHLGLALHADGVVGGAEGGQEVGFRHFVHLALHHHDVVVGCAYHELHVGAFKLLEGGVDNKLAIDAGHSHLGDGAVEGYVAHGEGGRGGKAGECVGHIDAVGRIEGHVDKGVGVVIVGEEGSKHAVDKARGQDLIVRGAPFALQEAAGKTAEGGEFFFVFNLKGHEVDPFAGLFGRHYGGKDHRVAHPQLYRSIGLLCQLAGLEGYLAAVGQGDGFFEGFKHKIYLLQLVLLSACISKCGQR